MMLDLVFIVLSGLALGSFGNNITAYFSGNSRFDFFRSTCACGERELNLSELVPVLSYLFRKGRCSECNNKLGLNYLIPEILTPVFGLLLYLRSGITFEFLISFCVVYLLILVSIIDLYSYRIPNLIVGTLLIIALFRFLILSEIQWSNIIASLTVVVLFTLLNKFYSFRKGTIAIGFGDIKLLAVLNLLFDFPLSAIGLWLSALIALPGILLLKQYVPQYGKDSRIPFGVFIGIGYTAIVFLDKNIMSIFNEFIGVNL